MHFSMCNNSSFFKYLAMRQHHILKIYLVILGAIIQADLKMGKNGTSRQRRCRDTFLEAYHS